MWLSDRDLCHAMERAVLIEGIGFAVLNLMSDNPGMRWDIETTMRTIGYAPRDGTTPVLTDAIVRDERSANDMRRFAARLDEGIDGAALVARLARSKNSLPHQSISKTTFLLYFPKAGATLGT
jgi:hypothetical protein